MLTSDIKILHVFKSCDMIEALTLPFPSGRYKIGSVANYFMTSCSTNTDFRSLEKSGLSKY